MVETDAFVATTRFGLGARPGDLRAVGGDGRDWVRQQLGAPDPGTESRLASLPPGAERVSRFASMRGGDEDERRERRKQLRTDFEAEVATHLSATAQSETPFRERLVAFWFNHFTVSAHRNGVEAVAGAFEREVIRANLDGRFADLLLASSRHPAMLLYLDNFRSIGPHSRAGARSGKGLNENLAREILELHSLGVDGGYAQDDVEGLAKLLTGWSVDFGERDGAAGTGRFAFESARHEPGAKFLLGDTFVGSGELDGRTALERLAVHPSTARHLATKLVRHFVADAPPAAAVESVARAFLESEGDLPTVHRALVDLDAAWSVPQTKLKTPWDWVISVARALGYADQGGVMLASMSYLGQVPWSAPSPQGWPDTAAAWLGPEAVLSRVDWAQEVAGRAGFDGSVLALAEDILGPVLSGRTAAAIRSQSGTAALALLLASPELQRR